MHDDQGRQLETLSDAGAEVIVCFDRDDAGTDTALQVAARVAQAGLWVTVRRATTLKPHQDDIEDFCRRFGEV